MIDNANTMIVNIYCDIIISIIIIISSSIIIVPRSEAGAIGSGREQAC